jgi:hypothetical protein
METLTCSATQLQMGFLFWVTIVGDSYHTVIVFYYSSILLAPLSFTCHQTFTDEYVFSAKDF